MERQSESNDNKISQPEVVSVGSMKTAMVCVAGLLIPGLGHALLRKWDRAIVFFGSILLLISVGIHLEGKLFDPDFNDLFTSLKFIADAGSGLFYWIPWLQGAGKGDLTAYTYDYANIFIYVAGLLNMLVVVDVFDIAMGRKQ
jgi:hypothetical protein